MRHSAPRSPRHSEAGVALAVTMVVMVILTLLGVMLLLRTDTNQLLAKNERDVAACRQAAEAATRQGINLAAPLYSASARFNGPLVACKTATQPSDCTTTNAMLAPSQIVDHPGGILDGAWNKKLYVTSPNDASGNIYISIYIRNNPDDSLPATPANQYFTDSDGEVTIVGEAQMTTDGAAPLTDRSNVRVRKMIAANIVIVGGASTAGGGNKSNSWHTGATY